MSDLLEAQKGAGTTRPPGDGSATPVRRALPLLLVLAMLVVGGLVAFLANREPAAAPPITDTRAEAIAEHRAAVQGAMHDDRAEAIAEHRAAVQGAMQDTRTEAIAEHRESMGG